MSVCCGGVVFGGCTGNLDDVETFVIIGNFEEIPVMVVSRSDLSVENGPPLEARGLHSKILQRSVHLDKTAREAKMRSATVNPR
jgi:hypothetical protein